MCRVSGGLVAALFLSVCLGLARPVEADAVTSGEQPAGRWHVAVGCNDARVAAAFDAGVGLKATPDVPALALASMDRSEGYFAQLYEAGLLEVAAFTLRDSMRQAEPVLYRKDAQVSALRKVSRFILRADKDDPSVVAESRPAPILMRTERQVRGFTEKHKTPLLILLTAGTVATQGYLHAAFYTWNRQNGNREVYFPADVHFAAEVHGAMLFATSYVAGLDPVQATGSTLIGDVIFQGFINLAGGHPFIWAEEGGVPFKVLGQEMPWKRVFPGNGRYAQLGVGAALIAYPYILRKLREL